MGPKTLGYSISGLLTMEQSYKQSQLPNDTQEINNAKLKCGYGETSGSDSGSESENSSDSHAEFSIIRETNFGQGALKLKIATKRVAKKSSPSTMDSKEDGTPSISYQPQSEAEANTSRPTASKSSSHPTVEVSESAPLKPMSPTVTKATADNQPKKVRLSKLQKTACMNSFIC